MNAAKRKDLSKAMLAAGLIFLAMEIAKQACLCARVFDNGYDVWYFPFQVCSMPIYLCIIAGIMGLRGSEKTGAIAGFLADYGFLGGVMALIVNEGFTSTGHAFITIHGFVWHAGMIALALWIRLRYEGSFGETGFGKEVKLFAFLSVIALLINVALHRYGDADMFYISPYHYSSQPVFGEIEKAIGDPFGRPIGIVFYLFMVTVGAAISRAITKNVAGLLKKRS